MKIIFFLQDDFKWRNESHKKILDKINSISIRTKNFTLLIDNEKFLGDIKDFSENLKIFNGKIVVRSIKFVMDEFEAVIKNSDLLVIDERQMQFLGYRIPYSYKGKFVFI